MMLHHVIKLNHILKLEFLEALDMGHGQSDLNNKFVKTSSCHELKCLEARNTTKIVKLVELDSYLKVTVI